MDPLDEIRRLYFNATRTTIQRDFERALDLPRPRLHGRAGRHAV